MKFRSRSNTNFNYPAQDDEPRFTPASSRPSHALPGRLVHGTNDQPCWCAACFNEGQRLADYRRNKELWGNGGFNG